MQSSQAIGADVPRRARRVRVPIPIRYRRLGDHDWANSTVLNLSESGVLFSATDLQPGTTVEVILSPPRVGRLASGRQLFEAEVVRTTNDGAVGARFCDAWFLLDASPYRPPSLLTDGSTELPA